MKFSVSIRFPFFFLSLLAAANASESIDLGELKVQGDIRRPAVEFYQLKSLHSTQLKDLSELSFNELERDLLKPVSKTEAAHERQ